MKNIPDAKYKFTEDDIFRLIDFLIDNICVECFGDIFLEVVGTTMGSNCVSLLADIFLYSYGVGFIQMLTNDGKNH